jgi:hypothetical protein
MKRPAQPFPRSTQLSCRCASPPSGHSREKKSVMPPQAGLQQSARLGVRTKSCDLRLMDSRPRGNDSATLMTCRCGPETQERRSLAVPPPCAIAASRPFGTLRRIARGLSASGSHAEPRGCPQSPWRPDHGPCLASRCYDVASVLAGPKPDSGGSRRREVPCRTRLTVLRRGRQTVALSACPSLRLWPSMAMGDRGLALPSRAFRIFPGAFGFLRWRLPHPARSQHRGYMTRPRMHAERVAFPHYPPA